jgi:hypothetical protein
VKAAQITVSIQWGGGLHYFIWTGDDLEYASRLAEQRQSVLTAKWLQRVPRLRGAKPHVYVWNRVGLS